MAIKAVLFDLDGTLLPMDLNVFMKHYFGGLAKRLAPYGYDPKTLVDAIWKGTAAMVGNDGSRTNEEAFWEVFVEAFGDRVKEDECHLDAYYREDFDAVKAVCGYDPLARAAVEVVRKKGFSAILATNPLFPKVATEARARWAGFDVSEFDLVTTYENSGYCKPNLQYYRDICERTGFSPEECVMVGNDVSEDMIAESLGMRVFLLTDCLLNKEDADITRYPSGGFPELIAFLEAL